MEAPRGQPPSHERTWKTHYQSVVVQIIIKATPPPHITSPTLELCSSDEKLAVFDSNKNEAHTHTHTRASV